MPASVAFFDTSAIVPLCVAEPGSQKARQAYRSFEKQLVAWTTMIEATSGLCRAAKLGGLNEANLNRALSRLAQLEQRWTEVVASERVRDIALGVLRIYDLRAGDAIQLASAIVWSKERARRRPFICFDKSLATAAMSCGFEVIAD